MEDKVKGFAGNVLVYDEEMFIDTNTGKGYDKVIEGMKEYINWYAGKVHLLAPPNGRQRNSMFPVSQQTEQRPP